MAKQFDQKVALVTGASRGIGKAIALRLAGEGAIIAANFRTGKEEAHQLVQDIVHAGGRAIAVQADVAQEQQVEQMVKTVVDAWGRIDILVNNAGVTRDRLMLRMSPSDWDEVLNVNLRGAFMCARRVLPYMLKERYGRIVNVSSIVGLTGNPGQVNYAASKAGLIGFTKALAREVASRNITVNALAPGYITTGMVGKVSEEIQKMILDRIPMGRFGTSDDVADTAAFLCTQGAGYITGQVIVIDGGLTA